MNTEDTINEIIYNVIANIPYATGPTGPSFIESIIDDDGFLYIDIIPMNDNFFDIGEENANILNLFTNQLYIQNNLKTLK